MQELPRDTTQSIQTPMLEIPVQGCGTLQAPGLNLLTILGFEIVGGVSLNPKL